MDQNCIFCKIANHNAPAKIEFENGSVMAFPSIDPAAQIHLIIIPKVHILTFADLEEMHKDIFMDMAKAAQELIKMKNIEGGYKLIFNGGKYQSIPHIHWHLLGGKMGDITKT